MSQRKKYGKTYLLRNGSKARHILSGVDWTHPMKITKAVKGGYGIDTIIAMLVTDGANNPLAFKGGAHGDEYDVVGVAP